MLKKKKCEPKKKCVLELSINYSFSKQKRLGEKNIVVALGVIHAGKTWKKNQFFFCLHQLVFWKPPTNMISALNLHFQRFQFVLLQLWLILLTFLVCFGSNQCPVPISECNAMYALNTSLNLPNSITNSGNNASNPCSKKKTKKNKIMKFNKLKSFKLFLFVSIYFVSIYDSKKNCFYFFNSLGRSLLLFFFANSNNSNQLA